MDNKDSIQTKKYLPLAFAAGMGSMLGSGIIVSLSATIPVWQSGLGLTNGQVGILSGALTFAIAFGSIIGGRVAEMIGLVRFFNWINLFYAIGAAVCIFSNSFLTLLIGVIIAGAASGADLPTSLTVVSHDSPDDVVSARLVSSTQIFWQVGIFVSYICSFVVSRMSGANGARIVFAILTVIALITWLWRTFSKKFKAFHEAGDQKYTVKQDSASTDDKISLSSVLFGKEKGKYLGIFIGILMFYILWNLLANTWGQFQTFMMVKADASQSLATGAGLILNLVSFGVSILFASIAGGKNRNRSFYIGSVIMLLALVGLALGGTSLWVIIFSIGFYNLGTPLAGEALYKVWTQESFPIEVRSSVQGLINGLSRICCALFAFITPALVMPSRIKTTMWGFVLVIIVSFIAGLVVINLQRKYHIQNNND
ncbi:MFS transporter [Lactiplantibacillus paraxiangfangensis]|uniref:MFS transporter n=1 Tax=Lactiplantibacillus paraxiangfangensis TaxID=3076224 RepID=UPI0030C682BB